MIGLHSLARLAWPAPDPLPARDEWICERVANWRPGPDTFGAATTDHLVALRKAATRHCAGCDVAWSDAAASCWSCDPAPGTTSDWSPA